MFTRPLSSLALMAGAIAVCLVGCSSTGEKTASPSPEAIDIAPYGNVVAKLDFSHGTVSMPLDAISLQTSAIGTKFLHAISVVTDSCLAKKGFSPISGKIDWTPPPEVENRRFGLWSVDNASKYGQSVSTTGQPSTFDTLPLGVAFNKAFTKCNEVAKKSLSAEIGFAESPNVDFRITTQSEDLAEASTAGRRAEKSWQACMEAKGLILDPSDGRPSAQYQAQGKEAEIGAAVTEATCAVETHAAQTLYDLQAQYETALMKAQTAQIAKFSAERSKVLRELDRVIAKG